MFPYEWNLRNGYPSDGIDKHGSKVLTTFACGGGSTMGYKLAGYDVVGANDIDPQMRDVYIKNHNPKHFFFKSIAGLHKSELPREFYGIDILDGSPPCSTFSMAGDREKVWGKNKKFREGQATQVLSDLFFDFIKLGELLQPKVIVAENVKGMIFGNAKGYVVEIKKQLEKAGYNVQLFCLNAATMGVPQKRERVFFICTRKDLNMPKLKLSFNEAPVLFRDIDEGDTPVVNKVIKSDMQYINACAMGKSIASVHPKGNNFNSIKLHPNRVCNTITSGSKIYHPKYVRALNNTELQKAGSFPIDYNFLGVKPQYLIGMSVPPVMMAQIAHQIYTQLLKNNNGNNLSPMVARRRGIQTRGRRRIKNRT